MRSIDNATYEILSPPPWRGAGRSCWCGLLAVAVIAFHASVASGQVTRFPSGAATSISPMVPRGGSPVDIPQTNLTPIGPPAVSAPPASATLGNPLFDPYSNGANAGSFQPALPPGALPPPSAMPSVGGGRSFGSLFTQPASPAATGGYSGFPAPELSPPAYAAPPGATPWQGAPYGGPPAFAAPSYPNTIYPSTAPSTLFPGGMFGSGGWTGSSSGLASYKLFQGPRLRHTFINAGDDANDLEINDTDASLVFAFPNFMYSNQPLYVVPSFSLHLWDGPHASTGADLPGQAYDAFVDVGWQTDPNQILGLELGVRLGAFTDFDTFNSDSIRLLGKALASFRLTPATTLKAGLYYLDRNDLKFVPAGGVLYQPTPYTRYDIFFPQPKFAHYWRTLGVYDVWWYLAGEYGGGSWTIQRDNGQEDSIDMNDLRVYAGLEWGQSEAIRAGRRSAFVEGGYVFDREVEYLSDPSDDFSPDDAFFIRAGIGY